MTSFSLFKRFSRIRTSFTASYVKYKYYIPSYGFCTNENTTDTETQNLQAYGTMEQYQLKKVDKIQARRPASINDNIHAIETPALLVDMNKLLFNMEQMNEILGKYDDQKFLKIRPHAKCHKCGEMVLLQLKTHGQRMDGICVQTIYEAEALLMSVSNFFASNPLQDIYLTNICVDLLKMWRFVQLFDGRSHLKLSLVCDDIYQLHLWNHTMQSYYNANIDALQHHSSSVVGSSLAELKILVNKHQVLKLGIMIELNAGQRIGIEPFTDEGKKEIIDIANTINTEEYSHNLYLRGLQIYDGQASHFRSEKERQSSVDKNVKIANWALDILNDCNISRESLIISGGSTGTFEYECASGVYDEIQCGSYIFNDADYERNGSSVQWKQSLTVLSTILNIYDRNDDKSEGKRVCNLLDIGLTSYSSDSGLPIPLKYHRPIYVLEEDPNLEKFIDLSLADIKQDVWVRNMGDEHTMVGGVEFNVGGRVEFQPSHCDTTNNLYNHIVLVKNGRVHGCWLIDGRGPGN